MRPIEAAPVDWSESDNIFAAARANAPKHGTSRDPTYRLLSRGAYPETPFAELVEGIRRGEQHVIDAAIAWLDLDPFCLWSGYAKQRLARRLAQASLSPGQCAAIRAVLLDVLPRGRREEFRDTCRLARAVQDEGFREALRHLVDSADEDLRQRAQWMLEGCERVAGLT